MNKASSGLSTGLSTRYRWMVTSRILAGFVGGYLVASLATSVLALGFARLFNHPQADALLITTMLSFVLYACLIVWTFSTSTATRAWAGIAVCMVVLCPLLWWLRLLADA